ncbi:peptidoglycan-binding protein LysM [Aequorivita viscosa]|nr:peptidoglycan-binding protein LysM [Aequorivita viscosa]
MKNLVIISTLALGAFFFGTDNAQAQDVNPATTTVNITLADVISILPSSAANGGNINFSYDTASAYHADQTKNQPNALIVTSTKTFDVAVKAGGTNFTDGTNLIPVDVLTIKPVSGGNTTMTGTQSNVVLTTNDQKIVTGATLGSEVVLDIDYEIPAAKASSPDILGKPAGTYTQTVIYTATVQ